MQDNEDNYTTPPAMSIAGLTSSRPPASKSTSSAQKQTNLFEMGLVSSSSGAEKNKKQVVVHNPSDAAYILLLQQRDDMKGVPLAPYHEKEKEYGEVSYQLQGLFRPVASGETPNLILMKDLKERKNILEIMVAARKHAIEQCVKLREDARTGMVHTKQSHVEDIESYWLWDKIRDACDQLLIDHDASRELQVQRKRQRKTTPVTIMHPVIAANPCVQEEEPLVHVETADGADCSYPLMMFLKRARRASCQRRRSSGSTQTTIEFVSKQRIMLASHRSCGSLPLLLPGK
jgi:hypothetical protein